MEAVERIDHEWTRVYDDTGGGSSVTGHRLLYIEGDEALAGCAIHGAFGIEPDCSTDLYGSCLDFKSADSFAEASWHERGCDYDRALQKPIKADSRTAWRPYAEPTDWMRRCQRSIRLAREHHSAHQGRDAMFYAERGEALALGILSGLLPYDHQLKADWALELLEWSKSRGALEFKGILPDNVPFVAEALGVCIHQAGFCLSQAKLGNDEFPENWSRFAGRLQGTDLPWICKHHPDPFGPLCVALAEFANGAPTINSLDLLGSLPAPLLNAMVQSRWNPVLNDDLRRAAHAFMERAILDESKTTGPNGIEPSHSAGGPRL